MTPGDISSEFERNRTGGFPSRYGYRTDTRLCCRDSLASVPSKKPRLTEPQRKRSRGPGRNPAAMFASSVYVPLMVQSEQERRTAGGIRDGNPSRNTSGLDQSRTRTKGAFEIGNRCGGLSERGALWAIFCSVRYPSKAGSERPATDELRTAQLRGSDLNETSFIATLR